MRPAVSIESLRYSYPPFRAGGSEVEALRGVDLEVRPGELLALIGPIGAGKSTLCQAIAGLVPHVWGGAFGGRVVVEGVDTRYVEPAELSRHVGLVFQDPEAQLFSVTAADEVAFGLESLALPRSEIASRVDWALGVVGLADLRTRSPRQLSGGQKQRLAIAAVLAMRPSVLVLDEPTASLDPRGSREVYEVIAELRRSSDLTVVLVEQDAERVVDLADRVAVLSEGRIVALGKPSEVLAAPSLRERYGVEPPPVCDLAAELRWFEPDLPSLATLDEAEKVLSPRLLNLCQLPGCMPCPEGQGYERLAVNGSDSRGLQAHSDHTPAIHGGECVPDQVVKARQTIGGALQAVDSGRTSVESPSDCEESGPGEAQPALEVRDLWYRYETGVEALRGISFSVPAGDRLAIVGQNGSGKTTLAKHFVGLFRPTRGAVLVEGRDAAGRSIGELAGRVGYVFQNPDHQIFAATVWEELAFGPQQLGLGGSEVRERVEEALRFFGLMAHRDSPPAVLGFGLRRAVGLAAVLTMRPRILVLDEPFTGLDWRATAVTLERLRELQKQGQTVVLVTHSMRAVAEFADHVLALAGGEVVALETPRALFGRPELLERAGLSRPQIAELAARLRHYGLGGDPLTAQELAEGYRAARAAVGTLGPKEEAGGALR